jgi:GAF domain-containing protein
MLAALRELAGEVRSAASSAEALAAVTAACTRLVPGAAAAGVTVVAADGYETRAATDELAERVDSIQFDVQDGPCIDAAVEETAFRVDDLRSDPRWPTFGPRAVEETGVLSMLSYRLFFEDDDLTAALNLYSTKPEAFDDAAQVIGLAATTYGAELITSERRHVDTVNLKRALDTNRDIGAAIGVLMTLHKVTRDQAFDLLRVASQNTHRKLVDIARDVVETGSLELR